MGSDYPFQAIDSFKITKSGEDISQPEGGGEEPTSVTFLYDSFEQEDDHYIARFNWVTPITTKITELYYAKKSDFDNNDGKFTDFVVGTNNTVDLSEALERAKYKGQGTDYSIEPIQSHKAETAVLEPGTEYVYAVGDGGENVTDLENPASFTTPKRDLDTFNFTMITDMHASGDPKNYERNGQTLDLALEEFPDTSFIISTGDQVSYGFNTDLWNGFFAGNAKTFAQVPLYLGAGNHELQGAGARTGWAPDELDWTSVDPTMQNLLGRYNPPKNGASFYGGGVENFQKEWYRDSKAYVLHRIITILFMVIHFSCRWIIVTVQVKSSKTG